MFQYAAGRALSVRLGQVLKLDLNDFGSYRLHQGYELSRIFNVATGAAAPDEIRAVLGWQKHRWIRRAFQGDWLAKIGVAHYLREPSLAYWPMFERFQGHAYLDGYWQSERYFGAIEHQLRADFSFPTPLEGVNLALAEQIPNEMSVSLHIRRGDYVANPQTAARHGTCGLDYYERAVRFIVERFEGTRFYAFSDDMAWVRENLGRLGLPLTCVGHNKGSDSYNDMRLMSLCKHNIIANSSFSWWAGWLNANDGKVVIAPAKWFADPQKQSSAQDLCPSGWTRI